MPHMLFFGYGYCAADLAEALRGRGWHLSATCRDDEKQAVLESQNIIPLRIDKAGLMAAQLDGVSHVLLSAAPNETGDPALPILQKILADQPDIADELDWLGYLSTTGVYGDHEGAWIDEDSPAGPLGARGQRRVDAENAWGALAARYEMPMHYFRLAGIYGPGRNQLASLKNGTARRIDKPGQVFSRIHLADISQILLASIDRPHAGRAYNLCDDEPAPPQDVVAFAAELLGVDAPPLVPFAQADLSPMAKSFYGENKRLKNDRIKNELGVHLRYPSYREGLRALYEAGDF